MKTPVTILWCGIAAYSTALGYAAGWGALAVSAVFFAPAFGLAALLRSRVRRKKVEERALGASARAVGVWLIVATLVGSLLISRPGREAAGMFGGLFFLWPMVVGIVTCVVISFWLPAKSTTYLR